MNRDSVLIESDELLTKLGANNLRIYDASILFFRTETDAPTAYQQYLQGHIPGAAFFDHQGFSDTHSEYEYMLLPQAELVTQIGQLGISQDTEVILYAVGVLPAATPAWWILHYAVTIMCACSMEDSLPGKRQAGNWNQGPASMKRRNSRVSSGRRCSPARKKCYKRWGMTASA